MQRPIEALDFSEFLIFAVQRGRSKCRALGCVTSSAQKAEAFPPCRGAQRHRTHHQHLLAAARRVVVLFPVVVGGG